MVRASSSRDGRSENLADNSPSDPEVEASSLSDLNVERFWDQFHIPKQYQLFVLGADGRVNSPPSSQVAFYV